MADEMIDGVQELSDEQLGEIGGGFSEGETRVMHCGNCEADTVWKCIGESTFKTSWTCAKCEENFLFHDIRGWHG